MEDGHSTPPSRGRAILGFIRSKLNYNKISVLKKLACKNNPVIYRRVLQELGDYKYKKKPVKGITLSQADYDTCCLILTVMVEKDFDYYYDQGDVKRTIERMIDLLSQETIVRKIKEVVVVEGKTDTATLKQLFDVDTIETSGSGINEDILSLIKTAASTRGVIVLTDPDYPHTGCS